jgi:SAM-dependent methyltransferase
MHLFAYTVRLKNFIKANFNEDTKAYGWTQSLYRKFIFPFERSAWQKKKSNGFESESALHMCSLLPKKTLDIVMRYYQPETWLDVGCGTGASLKYLKRHRIKIMGLENSDLAIKISKLGSFIKKHDLTLPINIGRRFDLVWCYEVAEHLPEEFANVFVDTLVCHGDNIVLSAATPGQGGDGHINEQPHSYWIKKMNDRGYNVDREITAEIQSLHELYSRNVHCFKKSTNLSAS